MSLRKIAGLLVAFGLVVGLIGGTSATFTNTLSASQAITVGVMDVQFDASSSGTISNNGKTLTCPAIHIVTVQGPYFGDIAPVCTFKVVNHGDIKPGQTTVSLAASTSGADLTKFAIAPSGLLGSAASYTLKTSDQTIGHVFGNGPFTVEAPLSWGQAAGGADLDNTDMGQAVTISFTLLAQQ
jgi:hypothetical protein